MSMSLSTAPEVRRDTFHIIGHDHLDREATLTTDNTARLVATQMSSSDGATRNAQSILGGNYAFYFFALGLISYVEYLFLLCILTGKLAVLYQVVYTNSLSA